MNNDFTNAEKELPKSEGTYECLLHYTDPAGIFMQFIRDIEFKNGSFQIDDLHRPNEKLRVAGWRGKK